jgi:putative transposase
VLAFIWRIGVERRAENQVVDGEIGATQGRQCALLAEVNRLTTSLSLTEGAEVRCGDRSLVVRQALGSDAVLVEDPQTGGIERLGISDLRPTTEEPADSSTTNLNDVSDRDWAEARRRQDLIAPLLDGTRCPRSIVVERARAGDCAATTLYRWARLYRASGRLSALLPEKSNGGRGKSRLNPAVEQILTQTIKEHYLTRQQRTVRSTAEEVARRQLPRGESERTKPEYGPAAHSRAADE